MFTTQEFQFCWLTLQSDFEPFLLEWGNFEAHCSLLVVSKVMEVSTHWFSEAGFAGGGGGGE